MEKNSKTNALAIIDAARKAAWDDSAESIRAAEREVERALGRLGLLETEGVAIVDEALVEIAKLHVREKIMRETQAAA